MKKHLLILAINIFAMNSFSYVTSIPIKLIIAGMTFKQHLQIRIASIFLNTLTAYLFDIW